MSENENLISSAELAEYLHISDRQIRNLFNDRKISGTIVGNKFMFDPKVCIDEFVKYQIELATGDGNRARKLAAEADLVESNAAIKAIELAEIRAEMHRSEDVQFIVSNMLAYIRTDVLSLVSRVPVLLGCPDLLDAQDKMQSEISLMLSRWQEFDYSKKPYRDIVRQRRGWKEKAEDDNDE